MAADKKLTMRKGADAAFDIHHCASASHDTTLTFHTCTARRTAGRSWIMHASVTENLSGPHIPPGRDIGRVEPHSEGTTPARPRTDGACLCKSQSNSPYARVASCSSRRFVMDWRTGCSFP